MAALLKKWKDTYFAPASFYKKIGRIALPIAGQQILNQGAGFVDTIMVSHVGGVGAVAVATQLDMLLGPVSFGINSGVNIYSSQFFGAKDWNSLKKCFGFQVMLNLLGALLFFLVAQFAGHGVLRFYASGDASLIGHGWQYLRIACFGYFFNALISAFSFMYRSIQQTQIPMTIGIGVNILNICLNYLLIFGKFGLPQMGIAGAALATVIANACGALAHIVYAVVTQQPFLGSFREMTARSGTFIKPIVKRMLPLIANEAIFGLGNTMYVKAYGLLSPDALSIYKIGNTVGSFFYVAVQGINSAVGLIVGEQLGRGDLAEAKRCVKYLFPVSAVLAACVALLISLLAQPLVSLFGLTDASIASGAVLMVRLFSVRIAARLFNVIFMSTIRAGGDSVFLMFLDCGIVWLVGVPLAFLSVYVFHVTSVSAMFAIIQCEQLVRMLIGYLRYRQGKWCRNLTAETQG